MDTRIRLAKEKRQDMISAIKAYFQKEREEELGDLAASLLLDFIIEKLAGEFYDQGVYDSYKFFNEEAEDLLELIKY